MFQHRVTIALACLLTLPCAPRSAAAGPFDLPPPRDWREAAGWERLTPEQVGQLATDQLLVTPRESKQVFEVYTGGRAPVFITSDSILVAYHALLEESAARLERRNAALLPRVLRHMLDRLGDAAKRATGDDAALAAATYRCRIVLNVALRLADDAPPPPPPPPPKLDEKEAAVVEAEVARVLAGKGSSLPQWLGPPGPSLLAIDYGRFKPRGFYAGSPALSRYFRATAFLQAIPFRLSDDREFLAIVLLGRTLSDGDYDTLRRYRKLFDCFDALIGPGDDWGMTKAVDAAGDGDIVIRGSGRGSLAARRDTLLQWAGNDDRPKINDQIRLRGEGGAADGITFRVLPAHRTPDAAMFQRTVGGGGRRALPDPLEVCAALGSAHARELLAPTPDLLAAIDGAKPFFARRGVYNQYLACVGALLGPPEKDAPPLFSSAAWRVKSCNTALAGWAQLRHTWALQAKENVHWMSATIMPAGFVEPAPEFFSRLADLAEETEQELQSRGTFDLDMGLAAANLRAAATLINEMKDEEFAHFPQFPGRPMDDRLRVESAMAAVEAMQKPEENLEFPPSAATARSRVPRILKFADDLDNGALPTDAKILLALRQGEGEIQPQWRELARLSRKLESLAHKQLRGVDFSAADQRLIKGYGESLAHLMFYGGNSWHDPKDDAPRVASVFADPVAGRYLQVGVSRPRTMYLLYPHKGQPVLCRGSVLPFRQHVAAERLDDEQWRALMNSKDAPAFPDWSAGVFGTPRN